MVVLVVCLLLNDNKIFLFKIPRSFQDFIYSLYQVIAHGCMALWKLAKVKG